MLALREVIYVGSWKAGGWVECGLESLVVYGRLYGKCDLMENHLHSFSLELRCVCWREEQ